MTRFVWDPKTQSFTEGKAGPALLPEHMRGLPSSFVTKDTSDGDKIHELDPPHIVKALVREQTNKEQTSAKPDAVEVLASSLAPIGERVPLNQTRIDLVRFRIIRARITRLAGSGVLNTKIDYVWFPEDNVNLYELRPVLPRKLPRHLRNYRLELDIFNWPRSIVDALVALGHKPPDIKEMIRVAKRRREVVEELGREESLIWTPGRADGGGIS